MIEPRPPDSPYGPGGVMLTEQLIGDVLDVLKRRQQATRGDIAARLRMMADRRYARWLSDDLVTTVGRALMALRSRRQAERSGGGRGGRWIAVAKQGLLSIPTPAQT